MVTYKVVVFCTVVIALAVNLPLLFQAPAMAEEAEVPKELWLPDVCMWAPSGWACQYAIKWLTCQENEQCVIDNGIAI